MAKLYFKYGTMFSGKSLEIQKAKSTYEIKGSSVAIGKPLIDTRSTGIKSRMGDEFQCDFLIEEDCNIKNKLRKYKKYDVIIIDESQFLTYEQVLDIADFTTENNTPVLAFGLKSDFKGNLFEGTKALLSMADSIEEIKGICQDKCCKKKSTMNLRVGDRGKVWRDGSQVSIGSDEYMALCRDHWLKAMKKGYYFPDGRTRSKLKLPSMKNINTFNYMGRYNEVDNKYSLITPYGNMSLLQNELISYKNNENIYQQVAQSLAVKYNLTSYEKFDVLNNLSK